MQQPSNADEKRREKMNSWMSAEDELRALNERMWRLKYGEDFVPPADYNVQPKPLETIPADRVKSCGFHPTLEILAVLSLDLSNMNLYDIKKVLLYKWLSALDLSKNKLKLEGAQILSNLNYLLYLDISENLLGSSSLPTMDSLQILCLQSNNLIRIDETYQPELLSLSLDGNNIEEIANVRSDLFPRLNQLCLKGNRLQSTIGIECTTIMHLYLNNNQITNIKDLSHLVNLRVLNLRDNKISSLEGINPGMKDLSYINVRSNLIQSLKEFHILNGLFSIREIVISENPMETKGDWPLRVELLAHMRYLVRINKEPVTAEERKSANVMRKILIEESTDENAWENDNFLAELTAKNRDWKGDANVPLKDEEV